MGRMFAMKSNIDLGTWGIQKGKSIKFSATKTGVP